MRNRSSKAPCSLTKASGLALVLVLALLGFSDLCMRPADSSSDGRPGIKISEPEFGPGRNSTVKRRSGFPCLECSYTIISRCDFIPSCSRESCYGHEHVCLKCLQKLV